MEKRKRAKRTALVKLRVSEGELEAIQRQLKKTTHRSLSEYLRKLALNKPVTVKIRNASADDFLEGMLTLQVGLQQICDTYSQAVLRLQLLHWLPEIKGWLLLHESTRATLLEQVGRIESLTLQLYEQWLQK